MSRSDLVPQRRNRDLDDPTEIAEMVRRFYADVAQDELLGPMFNEVAHVDWSEHLPKLAAFWCRALLSRPGYEGNPYRAHLLVHARRAFTREHFVRWLDLFHETLDMGWEGPGVERAKALAAKVAMVHSKQIIGDPVAYGDHGVIDVANGRDAHVATVGVNQATVVRAAVR
jgi:hemoglobin